ncbi:MAG: permease prefix domain 1-containing protein [Bryobacteraceae bacterium]
MRLEHWFYTIPLRLRSLFRRKQVERELEEELQLQLAQRIEQGIAMGKTPDEARYAALRAMDGIEQRKEECRDARRTVWIDSIVQDLRLALRTLRKSPAFTLTAIATLALGIGANTAIFALLDAVRLRSLPVPDPQKLALIQIEGGNRVGVTRLPNSLSYPVWEQVREHQRGFSGVFAWVPIRSNSAKARVNTL